MSNKRERFLEGRKRGKKVFKHYHGYNPDNENIVYQKSHPYPVTYIEVPPLDDLLFSEEELTKAYDLRDWNAVYAKDPAYDRRLVGLYSSTRKVCSCPGCGNPRRHFKGKKGLTRQELKQNEREKYE